MYRLSFLPTSLLGIHLGIGLRSTQSTVNIAFLHYTLQYAHGASLVLTQGPWHSVIHDPIGPIAFMTMSSHSSHCKVWYREKGNDDVLQVHCAPHTNLLLIVLAKSNSSGSSHTHHGMHMATMHTHTQTHAYTHTKYSYTAKSVSSQIVPAYSSVYTQRLFCIHFIYEPRVSCILDKCSATEPHPSPPLTSYLRLNLTRLPKLGLNSLCRPDAHIWVSVCFCFLFLLRTGLI